MYSKSNQQAESVSTRIDSVNGHCTAVECRIVFLIHPQPELRIEFDNFLDVHRHICDCNSVPLCHIELANGLSGKFLAPRTFNPPFKLIPSAQPLSVVRGENLRHVHFHIVNGSEVQSGGRAFFGQHNSFIEIEKERRHRGGQILTAAPWSIRLVESVEDCPSHVESDVRYSLSHQGCLTRTDGSSFSVAEAERILDLLRLLFSFVNGASCGVTLVKGESEESDLIWERYGSHHTAPGALYSSILPGHNHPRDSYDARCGAILQALFPGFLKYHSNSGWSLLKRAILLYLKSNETREAIVSIVLNQIALECLSNFIVESGDAQDSKAGLKPHEKIRRSLEWLRVDPRDPQDCNELEQTMLCCKKCDFIYTLTDIRNDLTHVRESMNLSDTNYIEAAGMGLWYVELLLLSIFGYDGVYRNRLTMQTENVPWSEPHTETDDNRPAFSQSQASP